MSTIFDIQNHLINCELLNLLATFHHFGKLVRDKCRYMTSIFYITNFQAAPVVPPNNAEDKIEDNIKELLKKQPKPDNDVYQDNPGKINVQI